MRYSDAHLRALADSISSAVADKARERGHIEDEDILATLKQIGSHVRSKRSLQIINDRICEHH